MKNNDIKTLKIAIYFLSIFAFLMFLGSFGYSLYKQKEIEKKIVEVTVDDNMIDDETGTRNDNINDIDDIANKLAEIEKSGIVDEVDDGLINNCFLNDKVVVKDGEVIRLYSREKVSIFEDCQQFSQLRKCIDGQLTGNMSYKFLHCQKSADCVLKNGDRMKNGSSRLFYSRKSVDPGDHCTRYSQMRECKNTVLTGDPRYEYYDCRVDRKNACFSPDGHVVRNNETHIFYQKKKVEYGEHCQDYGKEVRCSHGEWLGDPDWTIHKYWNCLEAVPRKCYLKDTVTQETIPIEHGKSMILYSKKYSTDTKNCKSFREPFKCINGTMVDTNKEHPISVEYFPYTVCYDN